MKARHGEATEDKPIGLRRVQVLPRETFDSASTPKAGEKREEPKDLAPVDLDRLRSKMSATIERAKAQPSPRRRRARRPSRAAWDPAELQKTVRELRAHVRCARLSIAAPIADISGQQVLVAEAGTLRAALKAAVGGQPQAGRGIAALIPDPRPAQTPVARPRPAAATRPAPTSAGGLEAGEQRILDTVAMLVARGISVNRESVARWQGLHPNGGRFNRNLARLREDGYLDGFRLTERGNAAARPLETGTVALLAALPDEGHRRVMGEIFAAGGPLSREDLAQRLSLHPNGGRYNRTLAWLRAMGAIPERGTIEATAGAHA